MSSVPYTGSMTAPAPDKVAARANWREFPKEQIWPIGAQLGLGMVALGLGGLLGLLQALERVRPEIYENPATSKYLDYYQGLSLHGVLLALVFTFTFANSFLSLTTMKAFQRPMRSTLLLQGSFVLGALGVVLAGFALLTNRANVLYTMYAPMTAHVSFYLGATLLVVSTWLVSLNQVLTLRDWRKEHPGEPMPLLAFASIVSFLMWDLASIGIAVEVLGFLIPASVGIVNAVNPQLTRTLFWFTGHAIVYFWLLPAYVSWYLMMPKQVGGKIYSDSLTRIVFILFLLFSVPTGLHHQYTDPGIPIWLKTAHFFTTIVIAVPSLITAFSLMSALELAGRSHGGKGLFGWIPKLGWGNPSVVMQLLAMLTFILGGITGIINASYTVNSVVHNTAFIPGHFHITVGTAVAQTIMGVCFWLVPYLTGNKLWQPKLGVAAAWLYTIGVLIFARGQMWGGIDGMPRRSAMGAAQYQPQEWMLSNQLTAIGGVLMTIAGVIFVLMMLMTVLVKNRGVTEIPVAEAVIGPRANWSGLDKLGRWFILAFVLIVLAYGPTFWDLARNGGRATPVRMPQMGYMPLQMPANMGPVLFALYAVFAIAALVGLWKVLLGKPSEPA